MVSSCPRVDGNDKKWYSDLQLEVNVGQGCEVSLCVWRGHIYSIRIHPLGTLISTFLANHAIFVDISAWTKAGPASPSPESDHFAFNNRNSQTSQRWQSRDLRVVKTATADFTSLCGKCGFRHSLKVQHWCVCNVNFKSSICCVECLDHKRFSSQRTFSFVH